MTIMLMVLKIVVKIVVLEVVMMIIIIHSAPDDEDNYDNVVCVVMCNFLNPDWLFKITIHGNNI